VEEASPLMQRHGHIEEGIVTIVRCLRVSGEIQEDGTFRVFHASLWHNGLCRHLGIVVDPEIRETVADAVYKSTCRWAI
jgi:hypothetical protein